MNNLDNEQNEEKIENINKPYYTENYTSKKPKNKKNKSGIRVGHLIIVALLSSIIGGTVVFAAFQFVAPILQPSLKSIFGSMVTGEETTENEVKTTENIVHEYITIESTEEYAAAAIAKKVTPSIVGIKIKSFVNNFYFGMQETSGGGSGVIISSDGYIMTNNHVVEPAMKNSTGIDMIEGAEITVVLADKEETSHKAIVVGRDPLTDLAVLKIDASGLTPAELGDSDKLQQGELAVAIGSPGGLMSSVTSGVISALNRKIEVDGVEMNFIQTDASINPGNSGGALVNSKGEVVGINTVKIVAQEYEGLGFAIPINDTKNIVADLMEFNYVTGRPYLGVASNPYFTESYAERNGVPAGVFVDTVMPLSGAYDAGMKEGDIITVFDGVRVKSFAEMVEVLSRHKPEDIIEVEVYREGETLVLEVKLGEKRE
ncbi:MAG: trypsin-like peptidase domain-containing protein [Eubacteriales bacterium]|nr:trypsin-like peptidase domain-containing protein [Eubacteriales bacterium]